ncbi:probable very-long-chain enoyl-CoA reductase art-1 [Aethina tumida]|uniref:probable very-long-chain enoyl-CoA reductase art-1 n=1 Tax=Aethina tumida TaxID=116153 RepID=UPI00096B6013|nr:probable very-long-chain enoyl-CoA reductase art-1 [Aethina tumida]
MAQVEVFSTSNKRLGEISVSESTTVRELKKKIASISKLSVPRQSLRSEIKGKDLKDDLTVASLDLKNTKKIFVKDLGPQIGWDTVFLLEYAGPLVLYAFVAYRPWFFYGSQQPSEGLSTAATIALGCWTVHYGKRLLETIFVHRFSHGTMPLRNLFKNCTYYWGFALYVAYHVNHPLFTPPPVIFQLLGLGIFAVSELGNLSIHLLLRDLRPPGTTVRKIPMPNSNPLTSLFNFVSCPNYTYEFGAWLGFTLLTSCLPAAMFGLAGLFQMSVWALGKHRNYKKEFPEYPKGRKAILPFVL